MADVEMIAAATAVAALSVYNYLLLAEDAINKKKPRRKRRWWVTTIHRNRTE